MVKPADYKRYWRSRQGRKRKLPGLDAHYSLPVELYKPKNKFDLIVSHMGAVFYTDEAVRMLRFLIRSLKPKGRIYVSGVIPSKQEAAVKNLVARENRIIEIDPPGRVLLYRFRIY